MFFRTKKKVFLHIGHGKTGTSSIQKFLLKESKNEESLFLYPESARIADGHHLLFKSEEKVFNNLYKEISETSKKIIIISSEQGLPNMRHFVNNNDYKVNFFKKLSSQFDTHIVYYVRNQFDILESSFLQHTKTNNSSLYASFLNTPNNPSYPQLLKNHFFPDNCEINWIDRAPTRQFDYHANLEEFWCRIFGKENIITKTYHKENLLHGDIISDFIALIDPSNKFLKNNNINKNYFENITEVYKTNRSGYLLDKETKSIIKQVFLDSNLLYAQKYLGKRDSNYLLSMFT